jgi:hypothetical protein
MIQKKVKKNDRKERTSSTLMLSNDQMILPQIMTSSNDSDSSRSRADSVKDKTKIINEQLNDVTFSYFLLMTI